MQPLDKNSRNQLERVVTKAREMAEAGARAALEHLGVGEQSDPVHLSEEEKILRRKLRIHGHQLGDTRDSESANPSVGKQDISLLTEEVAYEHWHRMLFARFLAENNLLMYWPEGDNEPIDIPLETCQELIDEGTEKAGSKWELASRFAARMLPQIFRPDSPVFQLTLPPEHQQGLERLLVDLPQDIFTASDSLGWVYQFWQAKRKDEVNNSEVKIGARELPAVTQLFTEPYMVSFLLDNSLGAWWAAHRLSQDDLKMAQTEEELRAKAAIPGVPLEYLRFVRREDGAWMPVAGTFENWPKHLCEFKALDPCCGSGHFLVAALLMLVPIRMELEGLTAREAVDAVLRENIHGLEIDKRCVELAAFTLALAAWRYTDTGGYRMLPELNLACSGLSLRIAKEEWKQLALDNHNLRIAFDWLYEMFKNAPVLGSLLDPAKTDAEKIVQWKELSQALKEALYQEQNDGQREAQVVVQGLAKASILLSAKYHWVITNVPYLARGKQSDILQNFCETYFPAAKNDLATVFLDRCLELCVYGGTSNVVLPQNWLYLAIHKKFREKLLREEVLHLVARLGSGAFETISGEVVKAILISLSRGTAKSQEKEVLADNLSNNAIKGIDASKPHTVLEKATLLRTAEIKSVDQAKQLKNPSSVISIEELTSGSLLGDYATCIEGLSTGDGEQFLLKYFEKDTIDVEWEYLIQNVTVNTYYGGRTDIVLWQQDKGRLRSFPSSHNFPSKNMTGFSVLGNKGFRITQMTEPKATIYTGEIFGKSAGTLVLRDNSIMAAVWCYITSPIFSEEINRVNQSLYKPVGTFLKVPFVLDCWARVAKEKYPSGLPKPYSNDPTQWIFHGHPCGSVIWDAIKKWTVHGSLRIDDKVMQVAIARLLGYHWPAELDSTMELADEQREWVKRCDSLLVFSDEDGIVCIPPVRGEAAASDRLLNLLAAAYGEKWTNNTLSDLLDACGHTGKTLDTWLRDKFFVQHCKLFHHRPFIWHIWDGLRDGFSVLVNYHKLDNKLLETLTYTYLGDWMSRQRQDIANGIDGAIEKLAVAETLKKKLELILEGEDPYDIFVRWKPIEKQPIGWNPDLNDGVRLNIRPFMTAGVLRFNKKPQINISWDKDRGKDVESALWYHLFKGDRINDHHLTLAEKRAAREKAIREEI